MKENIYITVTYSYPIVPRAPDNFFFLGSKCTLSFKSEEVRYSLISKPGSKMYSLIKQSGVQNVNVQNTHFFIVFVPILVITKHKQNLALTSETN